MYIFDRLSLAYLYLVYYDVMTKKLFNYFVSILFLFTGLGGQVTYADEPGSSGATIYVVPTITDDRILPTTAISESYISNEIPITASAGEFESASFVVTAIDDISSLSVEATPLEGASGSIPSSNIDIHVVKSWYQVVPGTSNRYLVPELLLKDDSLVKVDDGENYLKLTDGSYMWISDPTMVDDPGRSRSIDEIPVKDSDTLQPVNIPAGTNKQFWITVKVPDDAASGIYTSSITLSTPTEAIDTISLNVEVLPITLLEPNLEYGIYYLGKLSGSWPNGSIGPRYKSEQQFQAELQDMVDHGIPNATSYVGLYSDSVNTASLEREINLKRLAGMSVQHLYTMGAGREGATADNELNLNKVQEILSFAQSHDITDVYFYGRDEALWSGGVPAQEAIDILTSQRPIWEQVREMGGKIFVAGYPGGHFSDTRSPGDFGFVGDILDLFICYRTPSKEEAARWHSVGHKILAYANPVVGYEQPETYRRNYGLLLWQMDYDGAFPWAYNYSWGNPWNDFDYARKGQMFGYPTIDGVVGTLQWEGWREGIDDIRYLTTLIEAIKISEVEGIDVSAAEDWLVELKSLELSRQDLRLIRVKMLPYILHLQLATWGNLLGVMVIFILLTLFVISLRVYYVVSGFYSKQKLLNPKMEPS